MALTQEQGRETLILTIQKDLRHRDYDRVCEIAKEYTAYVTGEDIADMLIQFTPREDAEAFAQRVRLTELITPYIANRVMTPMYKAGRTLATKTFVWENSKSADENKKKLNDVLAKYYGDESLEDFLSYRHVELDSTDPNSFLVTELPGEYNPNDPNAKIEPYPFEVNSEEAINYKFRNNILKFLIVLNHIDKLNRFTIYLEDIAMVAQQVLKDDLTAAMKLYPNAEVIYKDPDKKDADEIYLLTVVPHKAGKIPAIRIGKKKDLKTRNRTCVPMIHAARSFLKKSVKAISEFDLSQSFHAFPQKITADNVCPGDMANQMICDNGKTPNGSTCTVCKGSGFNEHKSSQDIIRVKMPADLKDLSALNNLVVYKYGPTEILEFMKKLSLYELPDLAVQAVYTSELFARDTTTTTATEKNIDLESVYDALKSFTDQRSNIFKYTASIVAAYMSLSAGLTIEYKFPKDFKMKPIAMLLDELAKANTGGAPSYIKKEINRDIAQKLYVDKPDELLRIGVKEKFAPFDGKTEAEIATIITNGLSTKFNMILYANFDSIFDELDQKNSTDTVSFYKIETQAQRKLLVAKVEEYITNIEDEAAAGRANSIGLMPGDTNAGAGNTQDFTPQDIVNLASDPTQKVTIINANPGPDGGSYKIKMADGTEQDVTGKDLVAAQY